MSADYIGLTENAAGIILSNRGLQSSDFSLSENLISIFRGDGGEHNGKNIGLNLTNYKNGYVLTSPTEEFSAQKHTFTLDFRCCDLSSLNDSMLITLIQKTLRFCVKYWGNLGLNNNEYVPPSSSKAIVFPFPVASSTSYRITLERQPCEKRLSRRYPGKHLLAYRFGNNGGDGIKEECPTTNFNKSIECLFSHATYENKSDNQNSTNVATIPFTTANLATDNIDTSTLLGQINPYQHLSEKQRTFIETNYNEPSRIEGPAGSGKTICMILKMLYWAHKCYDDGLGFKFVFIAPSREIVNNVTYFIDVLTSNITDFPRESLDGIEVKTLQDICTDFLKQDIHESELLDEDTLESKNVQLLHLSEIISGKIKNISSLKDFISAELYNFLENEDELHISELIRHEISVIIKGRSAETFDVYKDITRPKYGAPISTINDRRFIFDVYTDYTEVLEKISQFDVDDIAISAMSKLDSPIWRRRRKHEGYDSIFIDEVHLFNLNELSLIHHLTKTTTLSPISYAIDLSQAIGDIAWNDIDFNESVGIQNNSEKVILKAVFRCSPEITDLAFSITSHGANLFTNFDNPISDSPYIYGNEVADEYPTYHLIDSATNIFHKAFEVADDTKSRLNLKTHQIAIIFFDRILFHEAIQYAKDAKKRYIEVTKRGDLISVNQAEKGALYVLTMADYVGGLEFEGVVLVGVDKGRIPDVSKATSMATKMFQNYVAHNRLYVSITRARRSVNIIGEFIRGESEILESAIKNKKITVTK